MATPTELAREAQKQIELLQAEFEIHQRGMENLKLFDLRERLVVLEQKIAKLERELEALKSLPIIADRVDRLERDRDESEKRRWQFAYIFAGAVATLLVTVLVQLVLLPLVKK